MIPVAGKRYGFEFKYADSRSMRTALQDLGLAHIWVIYPGDQTYRLDEKITVMPLEQLARLTVQLNAGT